jgi:hypothetical protein
LKTEFQDINKDCDVQFIQSDVSLLRNVDKVCEEIKAKEKTINLLLLSAGFLTTKGRDETSEGLDKKLSLHYYSRLRFAQNLLSLLNNATAVDSKAPASVVSVLGAGMEITINLDDLSLKNNYGLGAVKDHAITMNTLALEHLAMQNPSVRFMHTEPGPVLGTDILRGYPKILNTMLNVAGATVLRPWVTFAKESGERHLWDGLMATSPTGHAELFESNGDRSLKEKNIEKMMADGTGTKVWDHTMEVFKKVCEEDGVF